MTDTHSGGSLESRPAEPDRGAPSDGSLLMRGWLFVLLLQLLLLGLVARCGYLQVWRGEELADRQERSLRLHERVTARRGSITTRDGLHLAHDVPIWRVGIDPQVVAGSADSEELAELRLRRVMRMLAAEAIEPFAIETKHPSHVLERKAVERQRRKIRFSAIGVIREYSHVQRFLAWCRDARDPEGRRVGAFMSVTRELARRRPNGSLAAQIVGITQPDGSGLTGLEAALDSELRSITGVRDVRRASNGRRLSTDHSRSVAAIDGHDVVLTIDSYIQSVLENALMECHAEHGARVTMGVVMDPRNGAVLAMASTPLVDPETFAKLPPAEQERRRPQITHAVFEPGSTIKGFIFAESLIAGIDSGRTVTDGSMRAKVGPRSVTDSTRHGALTIEESVIHSSNIGLARVGQLLGRRRLVRCLRRFRLAERTGIEIFEEAGMSPASRWTSFSTVSVPFGYEVAVTPLQMARGYCAIANGGLEVRPHLVLRCGELRGPRPGTGRRILPASVARRVRETLRQGALVGTGRRLDGRGIGLAGKTGTAKASVDGAYPEGLYVSSFVGFVPWDAPRYLVLVVVDRPSGDAYYGGAVAGPTARAVLGLLMGEPQERVRREIAALDRGVRALPKATGDSKIRGESQGNVEGDGSWSRADAR